MTGEPLLPEWVIVGVPIANGVRIIASKNMRPGSSLSVIERTTVRTVNRQPVSLYQHDHWKITVLAEDVVLVDAPDYPTALRMLMSGWSVPDEAEPREIESVSGDTHAGTDERQAARRGEPPRGAAAPAPARGWDRP